MTLLFLHVPKTGGTTIHNDLHDTFGVSYLRSTLNRGRGGHDRRDQVERPDAALNERPRSTPGAKSFSAGK